MNFRADRARQLTRAFREASFPGFERPPLELGAFISLTEYSKDFVDVPVVFPQGRIENVLGECIERLGMTQLRIAETEKYAHVTFFFDGGAEREFVGEERILVPSPKVATYDLQPQMHAPELTDKLVEAIESGRFDFIICNYANADMVGHTGNFVPPRRRSRRLIPASAACTQRSRRSAARCSSLPITATPNRCRMTARAESHRARFESGAFIYVGRPARVSDQGALSDIAPPCFI